MAVVTAARMMAGIDLKKVIQAGDRAIGVGCIFHPSEWIQKHEALEEDLVLLRKALPLWQWGQEALDHVLSEALEPAKAEGGTQ